MRGTTLRRMTGLAALALASLGFVLADGLSAAPGTSLPGLRGGRLSDADLASGSHVLVVWASWSPRCRDIVPRVNDLGRRLGSRARLVTVNFQEDPPAIEAFLRQQPLEAPVFLDRDGEFSKGHAVTTLPGLIVVRDGQVVFQGRLETDAAAQVEQLLR